VLDPNFRNVRGLGHQGVGLFRKTFQMVDEQQGEDVSATEILRRTARPAMLSPGGGGGEDGRQARLSLYRQAAQQLDAFPSGEEGAQEQQQQQQQQQQEQQRLFMTSPTSFSTASPTSPLSAAGAQWVVDDSIGGGGRALSPLGSPTSPPGAEQYAFFGGDPSVIADLECLFRFAMQRRICKGTSQFHLNGCFAFLDRSARGGFDLEDFRQAVDALQLDFTEAQTTALFAK
jgi:hypothetical protein